MQPTWPSSASSPAVEPVYQENSFPKRVYQPLTAWPRRASSAWRAASAASAACFLAATSNPFSFSTWGKARKGGALVWHSRARAGANAAGTAVFAKREPFLFRLTQIGLDP